MSPVYEVSTDVEPVPQRLNDQPYFAQDPIFQRSSKICPDPCSCECLFCGEGRLPAPHLTKLLKSLTMVCLAACYSLMCKEKRKQTSRTGYLKIVPALRSSTSFVALYSGEAFCNAALALYVPSKLRGAKETNGQARNGQSLLLRNSECCADPRDHNTSEVFFCCFGIKDLKWLQFQEFVCSVLAKECNTLRLWDSIVGCGQGEHVGRIGASPETSVKNFWIPCVQILDGPPLRVIMKLPSHSCETLTTDRK
eukprot:1188700-Amphidinium_carterae.1